MTRYSNGIGRVRRFRNVIVMALLAVVLILGPTAVLAAVWTYQDIPAPQDVPQSTQWNFHQFLRPAAEGDAIAGGCMQEQAGFGLQCTANDISIATATNIVINDDGCAFPGDTVTFTADFEVLLTAQARYDVGLWFATDGDPNGDGARTGSCTAATPPYAPDPPWLDLDELETGQQGDTCGDINAAHNPLYPSVQLTVVCTDDDANGKLDLPNCTSWRQPGDNSLCTSPLQAVPGAPSKCKCDVGFNIDIPVPGQIIVDKVTSPSGDSTSFNFTLTGGPNPGVNIPFSLTDSSQPYKSSFLYAGTYSVVETANSSYSTGATCSDGSPASAIVLSPGETVTCTFTNTLRTGTLNVVKNLINDNLGPKTCPDFSFSVDGGAPVVFETDCTNSMTVLAGSHTVVESGVPITGYTTTYDKCENISVPANGTATCTITNDDVAVPAINVEKSSIMTEITAAGQVVPYTFVVTNADHVTLTGITVTDPMCDAAPVYQSGDANSDGKLQVAEAWTYTCDHTVTQAEMDAGGNLSNTVTADSNESEPDTDSLNIPITQNAAMTVKKSSATTSLSAPGTVTYDYLVTNTGNVTLTGIILSDNNDNNDMVCESNTLAVGASMTCTATHTFTQAELNAGGTLDNVVTASSNEAPDATDHLSLPITQTALISIVKSGTFDSGDDNYADVGELISYEFLVTNEGNVTLTGITVTDPLPGLSAIFCPMDTLAVGESMTCTATYAVTQADVDAGSVVNMATAGSNESPPDDDNNEESLPQNPHLTLVKTATPGTYDTVGDVIGYSYELTNSGNVTLVAPFMVTDDKATDEACPNTPAYLAPGDSITCTASYTITQFDLDTGSVKNTAQGHGLFGATPVDSNYDDETVTADQKPALSIVKTATPVVYDSVGDVIGYSYAVKNIGNVTLSGPFTVFDDKATNESCPVTATLAPGASITCTASYTITQGDLDAGSVKNTAYATVNFGDETVTSNTDDETVTADQKPALSIVKTATPSTYDAVGDVISYGYVVKNIGNVTLSGPFSVFDDKAANESCPATATLAPGASITCTASYTITATDLVGAGSVKNTAYATGNFGGETVTSNTDDETVYEQTAVMLPTQTTCAQYAAGPDAWPPMYSAFTYQAKANKINSVSPGVIFYYNTIQAPSASFTLNVVETNSRSWKPMLVQDLGQAILYTANCAKAPNVTVTTTNNPYTVTFTVTGATPGAIYYIGIKYSPQNLIGQAVPGKPTSIYSWSTTGYLGGVASIPVKPK